MDQWEYTTTTVDLELLEDDGLENHLKALGAEGWEAYSAFPKFPHSSQIVVMVKRLIRVS